MPDDTINIIAFPDGAENAEVLSLPDTDRFGRTIFREDAQTTAVPSSLIRDSLAHHLTTMRNIIQSVANDLGDLHVHEITLKFGLDKKLGCALIAQAGVQAAIELKLQVKKTTP